MDRRSLLHWLGVASTGTLAGCPSALRPNNNQTQHTPTVTVETTTTSGGLSIESGRVDPDSVPTPSPNPTPPPPDIERNTTPVSVQRRECEDPIPVDEAGSFTFTIWISNQTHTMQTLNPQIEHEMIPRCRFDEPPCSAPQDTEYRLDEQYTLGSDESIKLSKKVPMTDVVDQYAVGLDVVEDGEPITSGWIAGWEDGVQELNNQQRFEDADFMACNDTTEGVIIRVEGTADEDLQFEADE